MVHPVQSNVETFLVIQTVPADWSNLAVCTDEVLDPPHVVSEAYILKSVHVIHEPVGSQCVTVHRGLCAAEATLFPHGWQEQLVAENTGTDDLKNKTKKLVKQHKIRSETG